MVRASTINILNCHFMTDVTTVSHQHSLWMTSLSNNNNIVNFVGVVITVYNSDL